MECDRQVDCVDDWDEFECVMFECANGMLISGGLQCDGAPDCSDATDEQGCPPDFLCDNGLFILQLFVCDGMADCEGNNDGVVSDEVDCGLPFCLAP